MINVVIYTMEELQETLVPGLRTHKDAEMQVIKDLPRLQVFVGKTRVKTLRRLLDMLQAGSITLTLMRMLTQAVFAVFLEHIYTNFDTDEIVCSTDNACLQLLPSLHGYINICVHNFRTLETIDKFRGSFHIVDRFVVFELFSVDKSCCNSTRAGGIVCASGGGELK